MELLGVLILRLTLGLTFSMHGSQQVLGWFGGRGLKGAEATVTRIGFRPVWLWTWLSSFGNLLGGILITLGAFTVFGCALVITEMVVAILAVKVEKGFWNQNGGIEYNLALMGMGITTGLVGPGPASVDGALMPFLISPQLFLVLLALALGVAAIGFANRQPAREPAQH